MGDDNQGENAAFVDNGEDIVQAATFENLSDESSGSSNTENQMDMILDISVAISVEIGRTKMNIRNLLSLTQGAVVELDRLAGEALDVYVNGTLIAKGEVVMVHDKFGVRLTDIVSKSERIKRLK